MELQVEEKVNKYIPVGGGGLQGISTLHVPISFLLPLHINPPIEGDGLSHFLSLFFIPLQVFTQELQDNQEPQFPSIIVGFVVATVGGIIGATVGPCSQL